MILVHGLTKYSNLNYWEDDTRTHLIQESPSRQKVFIYYRNHFVIESAKTPEKLAKKHGFTLVEKVNKETVIN